jgi:hypothetical protein
VSIILSKHKHPLIFATSTHEFESDGTNHHQTHRRPKHSSTNAIHESGSEPESEPDTSRSTTPNFEDSENEEEANEDIGLARGDVPNAPFKEMMLPSSPVPDNDQMVDSTHHEQSTSSIAQLVSQQVSPEAPALSPIPDTTHLDTIFNTPAVEMNSTSTGRPKRTIRMRVQIDQGLTDVDGCTATHCEEPHRTSEKVKCAGVGCSSQVSSSLLHVPALAQESICWLKVSS